MGMCAYYEILFKPEAHEDYLYDLIICTEREKFIVPVTAVGNRPALDFPDCVDLGERPVKISAKRFLLVSNIGYKACTFSLSTEVPFFVCPHHARLEPQESLQCTVGCSVPRRGLHETDLKITFDYGEVLYSKLQITGREVDVDVPDSTVELLPTYVTRTSQRTFAIRNNSDHTITFSVRGTGDVDMEERHTADELKSLFCAENGPPSLSGCTESFEDLLETLQVNSLRQCVDVSGRRTQIDEAKKLLLRSHLFQDTTFAVIPSSGSIPSKSTIELAVEFRPSYAKQYETCAFVDVQGRESRIPIVIRGRGLGPEAVFSYDVLDVGDTFINTMHQYEVELQNRGKIDAQFMLLPKNTEFGSKFRFEPDNGVLVAGQVQIIKVSSWFLDRLSSLHAAFHADRVNVFKGETTVRRAG